MGGGLGVERTLAIAAVGRMSWGMDWREKRRGIRNWGLVLLRS